MSGRIFSMDIPAHQALQELLPWYAAAQLAPEEAARVRDHLQNCAQCRQDLEWEREMRAQAAASPLALPAGADMERALARLRPALGAQDPVPAAISDAALMSPAGLALPQQRKPAANQPSWLRWTMAAQWVLIAGLLTLLVRPVTAPASYRVLGAATNSAANIVLVFKPDTSERELRRILQTQGARVVDGPTVTDAYLIAVPAASRAHVLQSLRGETAVQLAETLDGGALP